MERCEELRENLSAYADGELDVATRGRVREHLDACADCRRELAALERVDALFRSVAAPAVPQGDWNRVSAAVDEALSPETIPLSSIRARAEQRHAGWWAFPATAVAAAAALIVAFVTMSPPPAPEIEVTVETGPNYESSVTVPASDDDFLIIDVTNVE